MPTSSQDVRAVRPEPVAAIRRAGRAPHQVLLFGAGMLTGIGLPSHETGLPGVVADRLHARSGRGVNLTVIVDPDPTSDRALEALPGLRLPRFEAVLVVLGEDAALRRTPSAEWATRAGALFDLLAAQAAPGAPVFVYDSARAVLANAGQRSRRLWRAAARQHAISERLAAPTGIRFAELTPSLHHLGLGGRFSPVAYSAWGEYIVERLRLALLETDEWMAPRTSHHRREGAVDEELRQQALDSMRLRSLQRDDLIDLMVKRAKAVFGADGAALNIIDGEEQWQLATTLPAPVTVPRSHAFCEVTIESEGLTLINNVRRDPRVADRPLAKNAAVSAGVPIHTWDGYRIGALCIYGDAPRSMRDSELQELQDLAGRIEQELWTDSLRRSREAALH
ncbi:MAG: hypothetical protein ACTHJL_11670 [Amnibacterium sp.]